MTGRIQLRAFMGLRELFKTRHWTNPKAVPVQGSIRGCELLAGLNIPAERVQMIFVNGRAFARDAAVIRPGDRVALVPAGAPIPFITGLYKPSAL